ncbi:hypothetical protein [Kocuria salina]|nr:hypothetical protein [Kocuria salina]
MRHVVTSVPTVSTTTGAPLVGMEAGAQPVNAAAVTIPATDARTQA